MFVFKKISLLFECFDVGEIQGNYFAYVLLKLLYVRDGGSALSSITVQGASCASMLLRLQTRCPMFVYAGPRSNT